MHKRIMQGVVVGDKMDKTWLLMWSASSRTRCTRNTSSGPSAITHDENNTHKVGDTVSIQEYVALKNQKVGSRL